MTKDTIRDYWTGSSLHEEYWSTQGRTAPVRPVYEARWQLSHAPSKGIYRKQYLHNTEIN